MTYPAYPEYKDSGVEWLGEVPAHWEVKRLRYVAELNPSKTEVRALPTESLVSFIPMEAVGDDGSLSLEQIRPISEVLAGYTYVSEGDVTIAKITPCFENGKGAVMRGLKNRVGFGTTELTVMRPKTSLTTSDYLYRVVTSEPFRALGESSMYGAGGQKRVPDDFVRNFTIAWPPYKEQAEIQAFLDHETARIDALVDEQQRLIELLKEKRQAVICHAVTKGLDPDVSMKDSGVEWLGEVPEHWDVLKLKRLARICNGRDYKIVEVEHGGYPVIGSGGEFARANDFLYGGESVLLGRKGTIDKPLYMNVAFWTVDTMFYTELSQRVGGRFLYYCATCFQYDQYSTNTALPSMAKEDLANIYMAVPNPQEQAHIANFLDCEIEHIELLIKEADSGIKLLQERRSALISAAVTGKTDVRGWQPPADSSVAGEAKQVESA